MTSTASALYGRGNCVYKKLCVYVHQGLGMSETIIESCLSHLVLPSISYVNLGKLYNFSVPWFFHL